MKILCLIPARSGSKGVPNKNIKLLGNKPLLAWSIEQALASKRVANMRIIVSTDSEEYKQIAIKWGAEVPFLRPIKISQDLSTDYEFISHALVWFKNKENYIPDIILQLRPTQPCRKVEDIDKLMDVTKQVEGHTICAFGDAAAWPIQGLIKHFRPEVEKRIAEYSKRNKVA